MKDRNKPHMQPVRRRGKPEAKGKEPVIKRPFKADDEVRLNRFIARSGVCSRREADTLIAAGQVSVNGAVVTELGTKVTPRDRVDVHGRRVVPVHLEYLLMNKSGDTITTTDDERGRTSVMDLIKDPALEKIGLFPVGRLDRHTTGVLLLTNDGDLAHRLMHPRYTIEKMYVAELEQEVTDEQLEALASGIELEDGPAKADRVARLPGGSRRVVGLSIHEGRNRQVRRMFESLGHRVRQLERVQYAGLTTDGVRKGKWRRLSRDEVAALYRKVKL